MFNTYTKISTKTNTNLKMNACSGGIYKTYLESWFKRFHLKSDYADTVFCNTSNIIILQMVICGDMEVIAELIYKKDLEKYLNNKED